LRAGVKRREALRAFDLGPSCQRCR
jgi:hypothetical protein